MLTTLYKLRYINPHSTISHRCPVSSRLIEFIIEWAMVFFDGIVSLGIVGYGQGQSSLITFISVMSVQNVNMEYYCISSVQHNLSYTWSNETKKKNPALLLLWYCLAFIPNCKYWSNGSKTVLLKMTFVNLEFLFLRHTTLNTTAKVTTAKKLGKSLWLWKV